MMRAALVCLATAASGSRLEKALQNCPRVHGFEATLQTGAVAALAENYALSECDRLVPTRRSSFFRLAAVRSKRPHVRAVWACPATELQARVMASSGSTVESCNIMAQCPAPGGRYTY